MCLLNNSQLKVPVMVLSLFAWICLLSIQPKTYCKVTAHEVIMTVQTNRSASFLIRFNTNAINNENNLTIADDSNVFIDFKFASKPYATYHVLYKSWLINESKRVEFHARHGNKYLESMLVVIHSINFTDAGLYYFDIYGSGAENDTQMYTARVPYRLHVIDIQIKLNSNSKSYSQKDILNITCKLMYIIPSQHAESQNLHVWLNTTSGYLNSTYGIVKNSYTKSENGIMTKDVTFTFEQIDYTFDQSTYNCLVSNSLTETSVDSKSIHSKPVRLNVRYRVRAANDRPNDEIIRLYDGESVELNCSGFIGNLSPTYSFECFKGKRIPINLTGHIVIEPINTGVLHRIQMTNLIFNSTCVCYASNNMTPTGKAMQKIFKILQYGQSKTSSYFKLDVPAEFYSLDLLIIFVIFFSNFFLFVLLVGYKLMKDFGSRFYFPSFSGSIR